MASEKWYSENFSLLKKLVKNRIRELRTEFCMELESIVDEMENDPDIDIYISARCKTYLHTVAKLKKQYIVLHGPIKKSTPKEPENTEQKTDE